MTPKPDYRQTTTQRYLHETCSTPRPRPCLQRGRGFTLLEIMVVLLLVGIVLSMVVLNVGGQRETQMKTAITRIQQVMKLAHEEAELNQYELAIKFSRHDYAFEVFDNGKLVPLNDAPAYMRPHQLDEDLYIELLRDGIRVSLDEENSGRIYLFSSGEMTPFELYLKRLDDDVRYHLTGTPIGDLIIDGLDDAPLQS